MKQSQLQDERQTDTTNTSSGKRSGPFYESGQMRRAKMHAARLIDSIDGYKALPRGLQRLVEACFVLETTDSRILAAYLKQTPAMVRMDFQRICTLLGQKIALQKPYKSVPVIREFA